MSLHLTTTLQHQRLTIFSGVIAGVFFLTACQSATESRPEQSVTNQYHRFANTPRDNDIPEVELDEPSLADIEDHYFRYLGVLGPTEFYMARTDHADTVSQGLCFIALNIDADEAVTECKSPDELDPMVIQLETPVEAFLIPDETLVDDLPDGWSQVRPNIVAVTEPELASEETEVLLPGIHDWEVYALQRT